MTLSFFRLVDGTRRCYNIFWLFAILMMFIIHPLPDGHSGETRRALIATPPSVTTVYFGKTSLRSSDVSTLQVLAKQLTAWLAEHHEVMVIIEGHADGRSNPEYSITLGQKMAEKVKNDLIALGVDSGRIKTISYGKDRLIDTHQCNEAWAKNRRVEIRINPGPR